MAATRGTVLALGLSQLVCWGVTYYLIGALGPAIEADLGWSAPLVHGGFSTALVAMGLVSSAVGRLIDRHGGRLVMAAGSCLSAAACVGLSWLLMLLMSNTIGIPVVKLRNAIYRKVTGSDLNTTTQDILLEYSGGQGLVDDVAAESQR